MRIYGKFSIDDGKQHVELEADTFAHLCDAIDAVHAQLERDYQTACVVNEHQDLEYISLAKRYDNTISLLRDASDVPISIGDVVRLTGSWRDLTVLGVGIVDAHEHSWGVFVREGSDYVWYNAEFLHHHATTVEDLILDVISRCVGHSPEYWDRPIAECAAKLKLADA